MWPRAPWGPKNKIKRHNQISYFQEIWGLPSFPEIMCLLGSFFKMDFRRRPFNQKPLVFTKNPRTHLEVQGSFGDEGTFQESKIMNFKDSIIRWDRKLETWFLFRRRICFRSFLSCQNPQNRHMGQHIFFWQKIQIFWQEFDIISDAETIFASTVSDSRASPCTDSRASPCSYDSGDLPGYDFRHFNGHAEHLMLAEMLKPVPSDSGMGIECTC